MKIIKFIPMLILYLLLSGCFAFKEHIVDYDYSYSGKFKKYKTYDFVETRGDSALNFDRSLIQKAIVRRLTSQGYERDIKKPNLLISYKIFFEDLVLKAYEQPSIEQFVGVNYTGLGSRFNFEEEELEEPDLNDEEKLDNYENYEPVLDDLEEDEEEELEEEYNAIACALHEGTLYVTLFDRKRKKTVWQGYASGLFGNENYNNRRAVRRAVNRIFDKYQILAKDFAYY